MEWPPAEDLLNELADQLNVRGLQREPVRVWGMSGVERVYLPDGRHMIFKYSREPFTDEARILAHVADRGLAVPKVLVSTTRHGVLGMLLEDLGLTARQPTLVEAAEAAVAVHRIPPPQRLPVLDSAPLAGLPERARSQLASLRAVGRWPDSDDIDTDLQRIADVVDERARDAEIPPFGLVHSEFHPSSLHIGAGGQPKLLDFARTFVGPGVLDLVSWQGTTSAPDRAALSELLHAYVRAGGTEFVLADRAGLDVASWELVSTGSGQFGGTWSKRTTGCPSRPATNMTRG